MRRHLAYAHYVFRHKFFVFLECLKIGVPIWNAVFHDWTKFRPSEWLPYARHFHNPDGSKKAAIPATGYSKSQDMDDAAFNAATDLHYARNKHHWEHYYNKDTGKCEPIPDVFIREMIADWRGAGRAQGKTDTCAWYMANVHRIKLEQNTRYAVEDYLRYGQYLQDMHHIS